MKTNAKLMTGFLLTGSLIVPPLYAQNPAGPPLNAPEVSASTPGIPDQLDRSGLGRPGGPGRPGRHGRISESRASFRNQQSSRGRGRGLTALTTITGTVGQLTGNNDFILDGFTLNNGSGTLTTVKFPAHLGQSIQQAIKSGSAISVTGFTEITLDGENRFRMTSLTAGKTTILDTPPTALPSPPPAPTVSTLTGKVADYQLDREGRVNGFMLTTSGDTKTIVRIPAHVAFQLSTLLSKGGTVTVQGYSKIPHEGQVQLEKVNILRPTVLTINGQQYLVR